MRDTRQPRSLPVLPPAARDGAGISRRDFVRLMGASAALAGAAACSPPREKILPFVRAQPELTPGVPLRFATSMTLDGHASGLIVTSREGRPIKVEGNPEHPASLGATTVFEQASVLSLYDPDRARGARERGTPIAMAKVLEQVRSPRSSGLRILCEPQSSPTLGALLARVLERHPGARVVFHAPADARGQQDGLRMLFGRPLCAQHDFTAARAVLALDADFLGSMPFSLRWAREFADQRRLSGPASDMNRLYAVETALSPTGMLADHRLAVRASELLAIAAELVGALASLGHGSAVTSPGLSPALSALRQRAARHAGWVAAAARDLASHEGASIVIAGERQPKEVHALAQLANLALGNVGRTVRYTEPALIDASLPAQQTLAELAAEMRAGEVETLLVLEGNPVYTAPADLRFAEALRRVPRSLHLTLYENETAHACRFALPAAHYLESWGDARAYDGTLSLVQPLIAPMFGGITPAELLSRLLADLRSGHELVRAQMRARLGGDAFEQRWEALLQRGFLQDSALPAVAATVPSPSAGDELAAALSLVPARGASQGLELRFALSPTVHDGRFANNAWLQELPEPSTKLTWGNAAMLGPATAARLGVADGTVLALSRHGRSVRVPALVAHGHAEGSATLYLGYGRAGEESTARGVGVDARALRTSDAPYFAPDVRVEVTTEQRTLARTQRHFAAGDRPIAPAASLAAYREQPDFTHELRGPLPSLLPESASAEPAWAMTIDTSVCTGCSSCVVACQAENNVPVVGERDVARGREMHWLRIDLYVAEGASGAQIVNQPMLCQHCEKAPCEYVCPVNATVHSPDGLNEMVYNRCIGTRFCSNNCPYKVRRFNFFDYQDRERTLLQRNPNVTVRARGVMEKCTYCVQRIRSAQIDARLQNRALSVGEVVTACQQACPTRAITFGSLGWREHDVVQWRQQPRAYAALHEQGTRPRTMYLAKIGNPNPELS